jgi:hypothetical protein
MYLRLKLFCAWSSLRMTRKLGGLWARAWAPALSRGATVLAVNAHSVASVARTPVDAIDRGGGVLRHTVDKGIRERDYLRV